MEYIIVQAGGKGTRLGHLTQNKPKALVPVENLPMLFHLFRKYPDKRFIIIADYQREVLRSYLECFAKVKYQVVNASGTGTCAGIRQALRLIPDHEPFMLVWSDLILPEALSLPDIREDYIGISETFPCRWCYVDGALREERSVAHGVAGFFLFTGKDKLAGVPESGELVRWMQSHKMRFAEISLAGTREFGMLEEYEGLEKEQCRPFNKMTVQDGLVVKVGLGEQGRRLAARECQWYKKAQELKVDTLPLIYGTDPLRMERILGKNIYEYDLPYGQKREILVKLVDALKSLHALQMVPADTFSTKAAYFTKTFERIDPVRSLIPFADWPEIVVNGRRCRNVFFHRRQLERRLEEIDCDQFAFIHGDCTFSNLMLREDGSPVMIDPRGYFGYMELYGDPLYDWAKLYYSIVGNYDRFNLNDFRLNLRDGEVDLRIVSNHWEDMEEDFFTLTGTNRDEIKLLHAVIWLSLSTYAWQNYDSICGAFYNGLYYLEEVL